MHLTTKTQSDIKTLLESMPFEEARNKILRTELGYDLDSPGHIFCLSWLESKEASLRDDCEETTLSIAKDDNRIASDALETARRNERWAMYAAIIAIVAAIIATMAYMKSP